MGQAFQYELVEKIEQNRSVIRFRAIDMSSRYPEVESDINSCSIVEIHANDHLSQLSHFSNFQEFWPQIGNPNCWNLFAVGKIDSGPYRGRMMLAGDETSESLKQRLEPLNMNEASQLYNDLTSALFAIHESGYAHGNITAESVAWNARLSCWQLLPGVIDQHRVFLDKPKDIFDLGNLLLRLIVGEKKPEGLEITEWIRSETFDSIPEWRTVLLGCLSEQTDKRWTSARALFGADPVPVPSPVDVSYDSHGAIISWPYLPDVETNLYEIGGTAAEPHGEVRACSATNNCGTLLGNGANRIRIPAPFHNRRFQTVAHDGEIVIFGDVVRLSDIPEISNLEVRIRNGMLRATWEWPEGIEIAVVAISSDGPVASPGDADRTFEVSRDVFRQSPWFMCSLDSCSDELFITIFSMKIINQITDYSTGASHGCRWRGSGSGHRLRYSIRRIGRPRTNAITCELSMSSSSDLRLPGLIVCVGYPFPPTSHNSAGAFSVLKLKAGISIRRGETITQKFEFTPPDLKRRWTARLFAQEPTDYSWLDITPSVPRGFILSE